MRIIFLAILFIGSTLAINAQQVYEELSSMSKGVQTGYSMAVPAIDAKLAQGVWKSLIKDYKGNVKSVKKIG